MKRALFFLSILGLALILPRSAYATVSDLPLDAVYSFTSNTPSEEANSPVPTQEVPNTYMQATVTKIIDSGTGTIDGQSQEWQTLLLTITNGPEKNKTITIDNGKDYIIGTFQKYSTGDRVIVAKPPATPGAMKDIYYITDRYRMPRVAALIILFFVLAIVFGRSRGITSIVGMLFSVLIIFYYIIPRITHGSDPFTTCITGSIIIIFVSLYLSHGFNRRTTLALVSTLIALSAAVGIDLAFVHFAHLIGNGTEEAFYLQFDNFSVDLQGLLLGGIIIGVLGVLDDVTTGQAAAVEEIHDANPELGFSTLYAKGISVGREHIASLVNTLVLAYVGASFPLLLLYSTQRLQPLWVTLNSSFIAEEIVRTLVGSSVLVLAVPLTTLLAAVWYSRQNVTVRATEVKSEVSVRALEKFWK